MREKIGEVILKLIHIFISVSISISIFFVGLIDDIYKISPWPRLTIEIILASIAWTNDLGIYTIDFPFLNIYTNLVPIISYLVTELVS